MAKNQMEHNQVTIIGEVVTELRYSHTRLGERFYQFELFVERLSEAVDVLPIMISEHQLSIEEDYRCERVSIEGQLRSFYYWEGNKRKLQLYVYVKNILFLERKRTEITTNDIFLEGYVCKAPFYRKTPKGREISEVMMAVTRENGREDHIPCICWGKNARYIKNAASGEHVKIWGRLQSREYIKCDKNNNKTVKITYEVSVNRIW